MRSEWSSKLETGASELQTKNIFSPEIFHHDSLTFICFFVLATMRVIFFIVVVTWSLFQMRSADQEEIIVKCLIVNF